MHCDPPIPTPLYSSAASDVYKRQKLMKYELRATGRTMLPLFLLTLLLGVFTRMSTAVVQHTHTNITESLNMLLIFAFVLALVGTAVFSVVLMVVRFRNNLMTDEGYLMFTLPVSVHQLLWAKLLVSCLLYTSPSPRDRQKSRMPSSA